MMNRMSVGRFHSVLVTNRNNNEKHSFLCFEVPPIDQKRMVAFINHFIVNTVTFLNEFMRNVESKFIEFESKLQTIEASLQIVEAKVFSIH